MSEFSKTVRTLEVNNVMDAAIARMASLGATIVRFELPVYDTLAPVATTPDFEARTVMERYFATLPPDAPVKSFAELVAARTSAVQNTLETELAVVDGMNSQAYKARFRAGGADQKTAEEHAPTSERALKTNYFRCSTSAMKARAHSLQ